MEMMIYQRMKLCEFFTIIFFIASCFQVSSAVSGDESKVLFNENSWQINLLLVVCSFSTLILAMVVCSWCPMKGFKQFDEDVEEHTADAFTTAIDMYPPLQSTPVLTDVRMLPVEFEPLPDIDMFRSSYPVSLAANRQSTPNTPSTWPVSEKSHRSYSESQQDAKVLHFPRDQLNYVSVMGTGWFGNVLSGEARNIEKSGKKTKVIIKQLKDGASDDEIMLFLAEVQPFRELEHPNILRLLGQCIDATPVLLILHHCAFGDLKSYLKKYQSDEKFFNHKGTVLQMAMDVANGLTYMHQYEYIHSDLAVRNCLVTSTLNIVLGDYGLAQDHFKEDYYVTPNDEMAIPIRWVAPESVVCLPDGNIEPKELTKQVNIWSFGVILWELIELAKQPYQALTDKEVLRYVLTDQTVRLPKPSHLGDVASRMYELMEFCWLPPEGRPTIKDCFLLLTSMHTNINKMKSAEFDKKWHDILPESTKRVSQSEIATAHHRNSGFENNFCDNNIRDAVMTHPLQADDDDDPYSTTPDIKIEIVQEDSGNDGVVSISSTDDQSNSGIVQSDTDNESTFEEGYLKNSSYSNLFPSFDIEASPGGAGDSASMTPQISGGRERGTENRMIEDIEHVIESDEIFTSNKTIGSSSRVSDIQRPVSRIGRRSLGDIVSTKGMCLADELKMSHNLANSTDFLSADIEASTDTTNTVTDVGDIDSADSESSQPEDFAPTTTQNTIPQDDDIMNGHDVDYVSTSSGEEIEESISGSAGSDSDNEIVDPLNDDPDPSPEKPRPCSDGLLEVSGDGGHESDLNDDTTRVNDMKGHSVFVTNNGGLVDSDDGLDESV